MSTPTETTPPPQSVSASTVALIVLVVAALASAPWIVTGAGWLLHQSWFTIPALLLVAVARWRPKSLLAAVLLARQYFVQRKTKTEPETV